MTSFSETFTQADGDVPSPPWNFVGMGLNNLKVVGNKARTDNSTVQYYAYRTWGVALDLAAQFTVEFDVESTSGSDHGVTLMFRDLVSGLGYGILVTSTVVHLQKYTSSTTHTNLTNAPYGTAGVTTGRVRATWDATRVGDRGIVAFDAGSGFSDIGSWDDAANNWQGGSHAMLARISSASSPTIENSMDTIWIEDALPSSDPGPPLEMRVRSRWDRHAPALRR